MGLMVFGHEVFAAFIFAASDDHGREKLPEPVNVAAPSGPLFDLCFGAAAFGIDRAQCREDGRNKVAENVGAGLVRRGLNIIRVVDKVRERLV
jgi:hypothetical protein